MGACPALELPTELWLEIVRQGDFGYSDLKRLSAVCKSLRKFVKVSLLTKSRLLPFLRYAWD